MREEKPLVRVLAESAFVAAAAPGVLLLLGWSEIQARQGRLGLDDPAAIPTTVSLILNGFALMVGTGFMLALIYLIAWLLLCWQEKRWVPLPGLAGLPLLAWMAAASLVTAGFAFVSIGKDLPVLFFGVTAVDLAVLLVVTLIASSLMMLSLANANWAKALTGNTVSGTLFMSLLAVGGLVAGASATGAAHGSDDAWGCTPFTALHMDAPGVDRNMTFRLISHQGGFYFLRDVALLGTNKTVKAVPDGQVRQVEYFPMDRTHHCGRSYP